MKLTVSLINIQKEVVFGSLKNQLPELANPPHRNSAVHYQLWLSDRDRRGNAIDGAVLSVANSIGNGFFAYRRSELKCESLANALVQDAVEATSRANRRGSVENVHAYLVTTFKRLVDKYLLHQSRVATVDDRYLEDLANEQQNLFAAVERLMDDVRLGEFMELMDSETRAVFAARIRGYSVTHIAKQLGIKRECLYVRYGRGLKKAVERFRNRGSV